MQKHKTIPTLKKELLILISRYVKLKASDERGYCNCFTCGIPVRMDTSFCQCGHCFSKSGYPALQLNLDNQRVQCDYCNITLNGNFEVFKEKLKADIGEERFNYLEAHKNDTVKLDRNDLESRINDIKNRIKILNEGF